MRILHCDACHAEVNECLKYAHWYDGKKPRNVYELKCIHDASNSDTYDGMIICHECIEKLLLQSRK